MLFVKGIILTAVVLILSPVAVSAQSALQSGGSVQQQPSPTQATGTLQNNSSNVQENKPSEVYTQNQPSSLSVVGNPSQTDPSVVVGASNTTNKADEFSKANENYLIIIAIIVAAVGLVVLLFAYRSGATNPEIVHEESAPQEIKAVETTEPKPKKAKKTGPKKKKKKAHR